jgi:hypothetical protein
LPGPRCYGKWRHTWIVVTLTYAMREMEIEHPCPSHKPYILSPKYVGIVQCLHMYASTDQKTQHHHHTESCDQEILQSHCSPFCTVYYVTCTCEYLHSQVHNRDAHKFLVVNPQRTCAGVTVVLCLCAYVHLQHKPGIVFSPEYTSQNLRNTKRFDCQLQFLSVVMCSNGWAVAFYGKE